MTHGQHDGSMSTDDLDLMSEYLADLSGEHSPRTIDTYASALRRACRELPSGLTQANQRELAAWLTEHHWGTRVVYQSALRSFYLWASHADHLDHDPAARLPRVRRQRRTPRPATHEQVRDILAHARRPVWLWALIAAYAGARPCEIAAMEPSDINEDNILIRGKGGHERITPTHPLIWRALRDHDEPPAGGATANRVSQRAAAHFDELGHPDVTMRPLRHWYGTYTLRGSGNLRVVQELMGHVSPATTAGYTAVASAEMRAAVLSLPTWRG